MIFNSKTGPNVPRPTSRDRSEEREMDFDEQRDYMDQDVPVGQFPTAEPGPIHQNLTVMPDWMNLNTEDINLALESLPIPLSNPLQGHVSPGISLQGAIQVNQKHEIHKTQLTHDQNIFLNSNRELVYDIVCRYRIQHLYRFYGIVYDLVYDIIYDV